MGAGAFDGRDDPHRTGARGREARPDASLALKAASVGPTGRARENARSREKKTRKTASGATPGGLRDRLLMKETLRGPLGGSLLLGVHARIKPIARNRSEWVIERGCGHAAAWLADRTAEDCPMRSILLRAPPTSTELATDHGQARLRLRFRRDVLDREDHGTVAASLSGCGLQRVAVAAGRRSGRERHSTCSSRFGDAQHVNSVSAPKKCRAGYNIKRN